MRKNFHIILILAMAIVMFAAACSSSPTPDAQPTESVVESPTESSTEIQPEAAQETEEPYPPPLPVYNPYPGPSEGSDEDKWTSWEEAVVVIKSGDVVEVYQAVTLHVTLVLGDGRVVLALEPGLDEVFRIIEECGDPCKDIVDKSE